MPDTRIMPEGERAWVLYNISSYYTKWHTDHHRYVEIDPYGNYRLKWEDGRFSIILIKTWLPKTFDAGTILPIENEPKYVSDKATVDARIHEINEKMNKERDIVELVDPTERR